MYCINFSNISVHSNVDTVVCMSVYGSMGAYISDVCQVGELLQAVSRRAHGVHTCCPVLAACEDHSHVVVH